MDLVFVPVRLPAAFDLADPELLIDTAAGRVPVRGVGVVDWVDQWLCVTGLRVARDGDRHLVRLLNGEEYWMTACPVWGRHAPDAVSARSPVGRLRQLGAQTQAA